MSDPQIAHFWDGDQRRDLVPVPAGNVASWPSGQTPEMGSGRIDGTVTGWRFEPLRLRPVPRVNGEPEFVAGIGGTRPDAAAECFRTEPDHRPPVSDCTCGFRVVRELRSLTRYMRRINFSRMNAACLLLVQSNGAGRYEGPADDPPDTLRVERYHFTPGGNVLLARAAAQTWEDIVRLVTDRAGLTLHIVSSFEAVSGGMAA